MHPEFNAKAAGQKQRWPTESSGGTRRASGEGCPRTLFADALQEKPRSEDGHVVIVQPIETTIEIIMITIKITSATRWKDASGAGRRAKDKVNADARGPIWRWRTDSRNRRLVSADSMWID